LPINFEISFKKGIYHVDIGVIVYIDGEEKMFAQLEHFFPLSEPISIIRGKNCSKDINVTWPDIPLENLGSYGTIKPQNV